MKMQNHKHTAPRHERLFELLRQQNLLILRKRGVHTKAADPKDQDSLSATALAFLNSASTACVFSPESTSEFE